METSLTPDPASPSALLEDHNSQGLSTTTLPTSGPAKDPGPEEMMAIATLLSWTFICVGQHIEDLINSTPSNFNTSQADTLNTY